MPRRLRHRAAAAYKNATAHPQHGHHRTTRHTSGSARSPGSCRPHRRVRRLDTNAPSPRSRLPFLAWAGHTSWSHSTHVALTAVKTKDTSPVTASSSTLNESTRHEIPDLKSILAHTHSPVSRAPRFVHNHFPVGHHPLHIVEDYVDVGERVALDCHQVCQVAGRDRA